MKKIIDYMTGDRKLFEQSYLKLYGRRDYSEEIAGIKRKILNKYICVLAVMTPLLIVSTILMFCVSNGGFIINGESKISFTRPEEGENPLRIPVRLEASLGENGSVTRNVMIEVKPEETEVVPGVIEMAEEMTINVETEINNLIWSINNSREGKSVVLPTELDSGVKLYWKEPDESRFPILLPVLFLLVFMIYQSRYTVIKKREKDAKESIIRDLPEFINKLVLLLNAGLVITSAVDRILSRYGSDGKEVKSYFYSQLLQVGRGIRETNIPLSGGLKEFAARSGVREFMRTANIISDNIDKGAELSIKLREESELLWLTKKKLAEEKGRIAETKLTFPLVIMLLVLIMVTIAPALMEM